MQQRSLPGRYSSFSARPAGCPQPSLHARHVASTQNFASRARGARLQATTSAATSSGEETRLSPEQSVDGETLRAAFREADRDGNGVLDREELRRLLAEGSRNLDPVTLEWLADAGAANIMDSFEPLDSADDGGGLTFDDFASLVRAGTLLDGKFAEYREAFARVDTSGDGRLSGVEVQAVFRELGQPIGETKLWKLFDKYDVDANGQIDFGEFLAFFQDELLELKDILRYLELRPRRGSAEGQQALIEAQLGAVSLIFSEAELDALLQQHSERLVVLEASMTWCRPCKGFERSYQKFAEAFADCALFLKVMGNSNGDCKRLVEERLNVPSTPTFTFFRKGVALSHVSGTSRQRLHDALLAHLEPEESPVANMSVFQQQVWRSKLGLA